MANGIYIWLLKTAKGGMQEMGGPQMVNGALRQDFGSKQVRSLRGLEKGKQYITAYSAGAREKFTLTKGPFFKDDRWRILIKLDVGESTFIKQMFLDDFNVVPYGHGGWNQHNWIEHV